MSVFSICKTVLLSTANNRELLYRLYAIAIGAAKLKALYAAKKSVLRYELKGNLIPVMICPFSCDSFRYIIQFVGFATLRNEDCFGGNPFFSAVFF